MNNQNSVLVVGNFLSKTIGSRGVCEDLAERLAGANWTVLTTSDRPGRVVRLLDMLWTVWKKRNHFGVATVDTFSGLSFFWAEAVSQALRFLGKPFVLILHGGNLPSFAKRYPERVKRLLATAYVVTTPSHFLLEEMRSYRSDIRLLSNAIDVGLYPFHLRSRLSPRLIWLRAFHDIYNPQMAPSVVMKLCESFPNTQLKMIGPDKGDGALEATRSQIRSLGLEQKIEIILGVPKNRVPYVLGCSDIFINTTNVDNTPVSVIEAMACGLCVVSTKVGGIPFLLENEQDALLVSPDDPQAMSAAIHRILVEPGLAERLSRNARKKAEEFDRSFVLPQREK
jgi:glycosyltransferase involved in cell wall biosynthesis